MAGDPDDPDEAHQAFVARLRQCRHRAAAGHGCAPARLVGQVVELDEIHLVDAEPLEGLLELGAGGRSLALAGLRRQEHVFAMALEPRGQAQLRVAVAGGGIDVVDARGGHHLQHLVGFVLTHGAERGSAEDEAAGFVPRGAEGVAGNGALAHGLRSLCLQATIPWSLLAFTLDWLVRATGRGRHPMRRDGDRALAYGGGGS